MFGSSSPFYQSLYDQQLIFDSFGFEYNCSEQYAFSVIGGDTPDPDKLVETVRAYITETLQSGIDADRFERVKRKKIGSYLRMLNSLKRLRLNLHVIVFVIAICLMCLNIMRKVHWKM